MRKQDLLRLPGLSNPWSVYRRHQLHRDYARRREHYHSIAQRQELRYDAQNVGPTVRRRLSLRGYTPRRRKLGEIHTYAFIPRVGWHDALFGDLRQLGPLSSFDYVGHGYSLEEFRRFDARAAARRTAMNTQFLSAVADEHRANPIDWIFIYANGTEIDADCVRRLRQTVGVPLVTMCLDDKQSWEAQVAIAPEFDLCWTSARVACEWYLAAGANPVYMPEGFDMNAYRPMKGGQDIPVSFIGGAYGFRPAAIEYLRHHGVDVRVYGAGWNSTSVWGDGQVEIINRSIINLGMGGIGYSEELTNVKTRDFEIPGTGGGMYLTSFNPDLALHFHVGEEIICYRSRDEMLELIRYYLQRPKEARAVADRARARCVREHRWLHRYTHVCELLGILTAGGEA